MDKEEVVYIYIHIYTHTHTHTMEYHSVIKKEWNISDYSNMDEPRYYHTKWSKSERKRQIHDITYM